MNAAKPIMHLVLSDWKAQALFWAMLVCIGLIIFLIYLLTRMY